MHIQPFLLLGASVVSEVARRVTGAVETWRSEWGFDSLTVDVECTRAWEALPQHRNVQWQLRYAVTGKCAWLAWQPEFARFVQRQMFPSDQRYSTQSQNAPSVAFEGAEAAVRALADRMMSVVCFQSDSIGVCDTTGPKEHAFATASGAVLARIRLGEQTVSCLLDHDCVGFVAGNAAPKPAVPLQRGGLNKAFGKIPVTLPIEIGQVEVDVGSLLTLAVGDVIRLNALVDQPLTVYGPGQEALFDAHLGALEGKIAVEVVRRSNLHV